MALSRRPISEAEVDGRLADLPGWARKGDHLHKKFEFDDFVQAFGFMTKVAIEAEKLDHHPNWSNVYKTVEVDLWTHDADGITDYDFELATKMNEHAG